MINNTTYTYKYYLDTVMETVQYVHIFSIIPLLLRKHNCKRLGLPRSACPIVSIAIVFYDQYTLTSHSTDQQLSIFR